MCNNFALINYCKVRDTKKNKTIRRGVMLADE